MGKENCSWHGQCWTWFLTVAQEGTEARKETEALECWQHSLNCLPLITNWHNFPTFYSFTDASHLAAGLIPAQSGIQTSWWSQLTGGSGGWGWIASTLQGAAAAQRSLCKWKDSVWSTLKSFSLCLDLGHGCTPRESAPSAALQTPFAHISC